MSPNKAVFAERVFGGIPVLCLGTERYMHYDDPQLWDEVGLS
ncbi:phosphohydrolase [Streptomyces sp. 769]|nr:phosphohydrolase [Streptomyces sp. 769]